MRTAGIALLLATATVLSVGSSGSKKPPPERLIREPPARARRPPPRRADNPPPYTACPAPRGTVYRPQLNRILARGPGVFLHGTLVEMVPWSALPNAARRAWAPARRAAGAGSFGGWRIRRFHPGDPCLGRAGLLPGDVVYSVNRLTLRHPTDLVRLWSALGSAKHLVVRLVRGDQPLVFVVRIAHRPTPRPAPRPFRN